jgi:hypothetical protein
MLGAQLGDDLGAGRVAVAEDARQIELRHQLIDDGAREAGKLAREIAPVERHRAAGHFPMAAWRVLAPALLGGAAIGAFNAVDLKAGRHHAGRNLRRAAKAPARQVRDPQGPRSHALLIGASAGAGLRDMAEGIGAGIAELRGIRRRADAEGIQDQNDGTPLHAA